MSLEDFKYFVNEPRVENLVLVFHPDSKFSKLDELRLRMSSSRNYHLEVRSAKGEIRSSCLPSIYIHLLFQATYQNTFYLKRHLAP